jgi:hypothetical protein
MVRWQAVAEQLVRDRQGALVAYAYLLTRNRGAAEDLVQDALVRTFTRRASFDHVYQEEGYVRKAIASGFLDGQRAWSRRARRERSVARAETVPSHAELVEADALTWEPKRQFEAVLLDAPCSATGTFRRHPEVLYRARPQIIAASAEFQAKLLEAAAQWLKPGGALVYSVCSLEPQEGEEVVSAFLKSGSGVTIDPPRPRELPDFLSQSPEGWVRILPGVVEEQGGVDGFFMARLVRSA